MAGLMVGGAFLGAFLNVVFDKLASASPQLVDFIREKNLGPLLERLEENLMVVNAVLDDAETKQISNCHVNKWLNELKDVVYMADDLLDEVSTIAATQKEVTSNLFSRLTEIVEKLDHILKLKLSLNLKEIATDNSSSRDPSTSVPDGKAYGRDEDKKAIIELMLDGNNGGEQVAVIPIVGMGGVGKTTLAQMLYNDDNLKQIFNFDFKAWVCVSEPFDIIKVTKTLIEALTQQACQINDFNSLQENLVQILRGKKFFIVLDDVWNEDYDRWNQLKKPFLHGMRGSKILVTTRSDEVASVVQTDQTFHLSQLSNEDCWSVFANHACLSQGSGENTIALEKIGLEIVKKCKGLPLAAQSLGSLLRRKRNIKDWNNVLNCDIWELSESESKIIPSLRISYHYLPSYLKRCFAYCSLYPKDYTIQKNDVILLWMAEDLLPPPKKGKTLKEVGDEYLDSLVSRSFLRRSRNQRNEECFGMHDLMHDLATFIGGEFYFRSDDLGEETNIGRKTRHLSFSNYSCPSSENFGEFNGSKFLRTFLRTGHAYGYYLYGRVEALCIELTNLDCLRVLSFRYFENVSALPDSISGMIHLRYLDLSSTGIESLPESLCSLYNLQTLKLERCGKLTMLPSGMQNLVNVHYLGIDGTSIKEMPKGMGKLKQLQHLPYFIVGMHEDVKIKELGGLSNLGGSFTIAKLENVENGSEALEARMMDKKHIRHLELVWSLDDEDCTDSQTEMDVLCKLEPHQDLESLEMFGYRGTRYPDWVGKSCFHNMTSIKLSDCKNCFTLPPSLGRLPSLRELSIKRMKSLVTIDASFFNNDNSDGGSLLTVVPFPSLEYLDFWEMPCWEVWSCSEQPRAFPLLKRLTIIRCPKLKGDLPSDLPALEELRIYDCKQLACSLPRAPAVREIKIHRSCDSLTSLAQDTYPNLKKLDISKCENLESVSVSQSGDGDGDGALQHLTELHIINCPNLVSLAREGLAAPSLTKFMVSECDKLESLPHRMNTLLPNLECLEIYNCPRIESFPEQGMPPSLKSIRIINCEKLVSGLAWPSMDMLTDVTIWGPCDGMKSFPKEGLLPPSLKKLWLQDFSSLETLDCKGLLHLTSLQQLVIQNCPKLENMAGERLPASLTQLHIYKCPLLGEQCRTKHPQIWPKISHINCITVDDKIVMWADGRVVAEQRFFAYHHQQGQRQARWLKPGHGRFKLNFDGSSLGNREDAGGGGLLRDGSSNFIFGLLVCKLSYALFLTAYLCVSNWGMAVLALNVRHCC